MSLEKYLRNHLYLTCMGGIYYPDLDDLNKEDKDNDAKKFNLTTLHFLIISIVFIAIVSVTAFAVLNASYSGKKNQTSKRAKIPLPAQRFVTVTPALVSLTGKIDCITKENIKENKECEIGFQTKDSLYKVANLMEKDLASGRIPRRKEIAIEGFLHPVTARSTIANLSITNIKSSSSNNITLPVLLTPALNPSQTPTSIPTVIPTPTDAPPGNIEYIIDNKNNLNNQIIDVSGYLVGGNFGGEACDFLEICNNSVFIVSDDSSVNRDTSKDVIVKAATTEKEEDYALSQPIFFKAKVTIENNAVVLEKIY